MGNRRRMLRDLLKNSENLSVLVLVKTDLSVLKENWIWKAFFAHINI